MCSSSPTEKNELLMGEFARFDFVALEEKAADLQGVLLEKSWTELLLHAKERQRL